MNQRFDFSYLFRRASTWCALVALAATSTLGAYVLFPERLQGLIPDTVLIGLGALAMGATFATPFATSFQQKGIPPKNAGTPPADNREVP